MFVFLILIPPCLGKNVILSKVKPMVTSGRTAKDIMTSPVCTVQPVDSLEKVIDVICRRCVSGVPVVEGKGHLIGLISEHDILHAMYPGNVVTQEKPPSRRAAQSLRNVSKLLARDIMVTQVITAHPETEPLRLASIMALQKIRRIPIVEGETLVGIVSYGDVCRAIFGMRGFGDKSSGPGS